MNFLFHSGYSNVYVLSHVSIHVCACTCSVSTATRVAFAAQAVSVYEGEPAVVRLVASGLLTGDIAVYLLSDGAVCESCTCAYSMRSYFWTKAMCYTFAHVTFSTYTVHLQYITVHLRMPAVYMML